MAQEPIRDPRFGAEGRGIYLLPIGIVACFLSSAIALSGSMSPELLVFDSPKLIFIWVLSTSASAFFLVVAVGGCRILMQARHVLQKIERRERIVLQPYLGATIKVARQDIESIETVPICRSWLPMTLLSRTTSNWTIKLRNGRQYYIGGELVKLDEYLQQ